MGVNLVKLAIKWLSMHCFYFPKQKTNWLWHKDLKVFSDTISHGVSKEPEAYLEPSQASTREHFCKKNNCKL